MSNPQLGLKLQEFTTLLVSKKLVDPMNPPSLTSKTAMMQFTFKMMSDAQIREKILDLGPLLQKAMKDAGIKPEDLMSNKESAPSSMDLVGMLLKAGAEPVDGKKK